MAFNDPRLFDDAARQSDQLSRAVRYVSHSRLKRGLDLLVSVALLVMVFPLMLLISAMLWRRTGGKIFDQRPLIGRQGAEFKAFLFCADPETGFGRWLLASGLVSLPQLFNVLLGEMSLVGPRPLQISDFGQIKNSVSLYMSVRPGMTGLWYVSDERSLGDVAQTRLDRIYMKTGSFLMDLAILVRTPFVALRLG